MRKIKKIIGTILLLNSSGLFAANLDTVCLTQCGSAAWDFGIQALYLKPSYSGEYAYLNDTRVSPHVDRRNALEANWDWGFKLEGSYHFNPNNDLNLNWYHYKQPTTGSFVFRTNPTADVYTHEPTWNAVNLEVGQYARFNEMNILRLHGGLQYAQLKTTYEGHGTDPITGPGTENVFMQYYGVGPRVGADIIIYSANTGLAFAAKGAAAMLAGDRKFNYSETFGVGYATSGSNFAVVPEAELKLEGQYNYITSVGTFNVTLGYLFVNYFNALADHDEFEAAETDLAFNGPYLGIKWTGCVNKRNNFKGI